MILPPPSPALPDTPRTLPALAGSGFDVIRGTKTQAVFQWDLVDTSLERTQGWDAVDSNHALPDSYRGKYIPRNAVFTSIPSGTRARES